MTGDNDFRVKLCMCVRQESGEIMLVEGLQDCLAPGPTSRLKGFIPKSNTVKTEGLFKSHLKTIYNFHKGQKVSAVRVK